MIKWIWPLYLWGLTQSDRLYLLVALVVLHGILYLSNTNRIPVIFRFLAFYHWVQITIKVFYCSMLNLNINQFILNKSYFHAFLMSLLMLASFYVGLTMAWRKLGLDIRIPSPSTRELFSSKQAVRVYLVTRPLFFLARDGFGEVLRNFGGIGTIVAEFNKLYIFVLLLVFVALLQAKKRVVFATILIVEILLGFNSHFSSFKWPIMMGIIAYYSFNEPPFKLSVYSRVIAVMAILSLGLSWTAIKSDYRKDLNGGNADFQISSSYSDRMSNVFSLTSSLTKEDLSLAGMALVNRLSYIDYLGVIIERVGDEVDFEYGTLWLQAITRPFKPRLFFPQKEILDDSLRTSKYTGIHFANLNDGTSVSLGYYTESFIDFGYFSFLFMFLLGTSFVLVSRFIATVIKRPELRFIVLTTIYHNLYLLEIRNDKLVGSLIISMVLLPFIFVIFSKILLRIGIFKYREDIRT